MKALILAATLLVIAGTTSAAKPAHKASAKPAQAEPAKLPPKLEFKSLVVGEPTTTDQVIHALAYPCGTDAYPCDQYVQKLHDNDAVTCKPDDDGEQKCTGYTTILKARAFVAVTIGSDGCLQDLYLNFANSMFADVVASLTQKFGPPTRTEKTQVHNGFGAIYDEEDSIWDGANTGQLYAEQYAGQIDESSIDFTTAAHRNKPRKIKGANDI